MTSAQKRVYEAAMAHWEYDKLPLPIESGAHVRGFWNARKSNELDFALEKACAAASKAGKGRK